MAFVRLSPSEFSSAGRAVMLRCFECGNRSRIDPQLIEFAYGEDFDMEHGKAELKSAFGCNCGSHNTEIQYEQAEPRVEPAIEADLEWDERRSA